MDRCMCIGYLGNTWHQDTLWKEFKRAGGSMMVCSAAKPWTLLSMGMLYTTYPKHCCRWCTSSSTRITDTATKKSGSGMVWEAQQWLWGADWPSNFKNLNPASVGCARQTSLSPCNLQDLLLTFGARHHSTFRGLVEFMPWWVAAFLSVKERHNIIPDQCIYRYSLTLILEACNLYITLWSDSFSSTRWYFCELKKKTFMTMIQSDDTEIFM